MARPVVVVLPLQQPPAEVHPAAGAGVVNFFVYLLSDIAAPQVARGAVKRAAPRVAQSVRPHLVLAEHADERVIARDRVTRSPRGIERIDAQDLAEERVDVLGPVLGI